MFQYFSFTREKVVVVHGFVIIKKHTTLLEKISSVSVENNKSMGYLGTPNVSVLHARGRE